MHPVDGVVAALLFGGTDEVAEELRPRILAAVKKRTPTSVSRDFKSMKKQYLERFEREYLAEILTDARGNISKASEISGINRVNFYKLLKRHEIDPATFR